MMGVVPQIAAGLLVQRGSDQQDVCIRHRKPGREASRQFGDRFMIGCLCFGVWCTELPLAITRLPLVIVKYTRKSMTVMSIPRPDSVF
jgi:hypothetical protein